MYCEGVERTAVTFRARDDRLLDWYSRRRSGAGAPAPTPSRSAAPRWSQRIEGDYLNVVGLPLALLLSLAPEVLP